MTSAGTYWRTVRHLKPRQIIGRVLFKLPASAPGTAPAPAIRKVSGSWVLPARRMQSLVTKSRFRFLNQEHSLDDVGWDSAVVDKLWRYNLHYFDDLNSAGCGGRAEWHSELVNRWIRENPPIDGSGWEPYPTSLRIVNWIKWMLGGVPAQNAWVDSLAIQARWLSRRLEWHLLGNHLFANAKALVYAGLYFHGAEADSWLRRGVRILEQQLAEQILPDGGQFERTPLYHCLALEDVLDLINVISAFPDAADRRLTDLRLELGRVATRMCMWTEVMRHEDGTLPLFNDTADGIAPAAAELERLASRLGVLISREILMPIHVLPDTGYVRLNWSEARAFLDVAPIGPDYLPGHAHADTLSFELSVRGRRMIVNRGTSCYGSSSRRAYERSTAAHSTVEVHGVDSSEVWGSFRVGRRARPVDLSLTKDRIACGHDGYRFMRGTPMHTRRWMLLESGLVVDDELKPEVASVARYHLAPGLRADRVSEQEWRIMEGERLLSVLHLRIGTARAVPTEHANGFGALVPAETVELDLVNGRSVTHWSW